MVWAAGEHEGDLRFGSDDEPGIRRRGQQRFSYVDDRTGRRAAAAHADRIRALAIPPAWTDVWIAGDAASHLQATGRDARGRKQYRYHPDFTESRSQNKFSELTAFGTVLGRLRRRVASDLRDEQASHDAVVALVVRLLDLTSLRVGNEQYARANRSYGLTTLRNRHAAVRGTHVRFTFRGKSAHDFDIDIDNPTLARLVRRCQHLPGQLLFTYRTDDGATRSISSNDVNGYLGEHAAPGVTAKTFRTWNATVQAATELSAAASAEESPSATTVNRVIDDVARTLGNTRAVCRASYVHPSVTAAYLDQTLTRSWNRPVSSRPTGTTADERRVLRLLQAGRRSARSGG